MLFAKFVHFDCLLDFLMNDIHCISFILGKNN